MRDRAAIWVRDWSMLGGLTSGLAPLAALFLLYPAEWVVWVSMTCLSGAVSGALVGLGLHRGFARVPRGAWVGASLWAPPALAVWGGAVSSMPILLVNPRLWPISFLAGCMAAIAQLAWFAPAYAWMARRGRTRMPLVLLSALVAPLLGLALIGLPFLAFAVSIGPQRILDSW